MSFYIAIISFIGSVLTGLILMLTKGGLPKDKFRLIFSLHLILLFGFLASVFLKRGQDTNVNYFFTAFICSAIMISGMAWKSDISKWIKYYLSVFLLCIPLFIVSPSTLLNFILTTSFTGGNAESFLVTGRIYIERQNTVMGPDSLPHYKVIEKKGLFHSTIERDLVFGGKLDSIKVLDLGDKAATVRGYSSVKTFVSNRIDSVDLEISLAKYQRDNIEYRL